MSKSQKIIIGFCIVIFVLIIVYVFVAHEEPGGAESLYKDNSQSQNTFIPDASIKPDLNYLRDQIFHPVGGGG